MNKYSYDSENMDIWCYWTFCKLHKDYVRNVNCNNNCLKCEYYSEDKKYIKNK